MFFFSRFRVGASHLGHNPSVLSEMEKLDTVKNGGPGGKDANLSQANDRKQLSRRGSTLLRSWGSHTHTHTCGCACMYGSWSGAAVPPSDDLYLCV